MQSGLYVTLLRTGRARTPLDDDRRECREPEHARLPRRGGRLQDAAFAHGSKARRLCVAGQPLSLARPGIPLKTDNPLDVAVQGDGWLALQAPSGTVYTRDGRMRMQSNGALVSVNGYAVLDAGNAPILLDPDGGPSPLRKTA